MLTGVTPATLSRSEESVVAARGSAAGFRRPAVCGSESITASIEARGNGRSEVVVIDAGAAAADATGEPAPASSADTVTIAGTTSDTDTVLAVAIPKLIL
ncbi:hypothetical protein ACWIGI_37600 [Nocardia sp. NPDC055321]